MSNYLERLLYRTAFISSGQRYIFTRGLSIEVVVKSYLYCLNVCCVLIIRQMLYDPQCLFPWLSWKCTGLGGPEEDHQLHHCCWTGRVGEREVVEEEEEEEEEVKVYQCKINSLFDKHLVPIICIEQMCHTLLKKP